MSTKPQTTPTEYAHIVCTPGVVGGEPRIADTRIRVRDVVLARDRQAATPEEIVATIYPQLSLAQVYAALAYYEDHRAEIDALQQSENDYLDAVRKSPPRYAVDTAAPSLDDVHASLSKRFASGEHDVAQRHNEHHP